MELVERNEDDPSLPLQFFESSMPVKENQIEKNYQFIGSWILLTKLK